MVCLVPVYCQEGDCGSLVWTAASKMGGKHVLENVEAVHGVRRKGCEPFQSRALEGCEKGFAEDCILGRVQGDMGDVYFEVFIRVGFAGVAVQREGFPLGRKGVLAIKSVKG